MVLTDATRSTNTQCLQKHKSSCNGLENRSNNGDLFFCKQFTLYMKILFPNRSICEKEGAKKSMSIIFVFVVVAAYVIFVVSYYCCYSLYNFLFFSSVLLSHNKSSRKLERHGVLVF